MSMHKTDAELGTKVQEHLTALGLETVTKMPNHAKALDFMRHGVQGFLLSMGLDINDESLKDTPQRVGSMFTKELCYGLDYSNFPKCTTTPNGRTVSRSFTSGDIHKANTAHGSRLSMLELGRTLGVPIGDGTEWSYQPDDKTGYIEFKWHTGQTDEMVMVDSIQTISLCEHHFQTIEGVTHIAYIPGLRLLGLSKFARVTNFFARRPQVQERMTEQIFAALELILGTPDVAVQQVAVHHCMRSRGAMDPISKTTTSKMGGRFMSNPALRNEFLQAIPKG